MKILLIFFIKTQMYLQRCIPNPVRYLRWRLFQKWLQKLLLDVWQYSEYASVLQVQMFLFFKKNIVGDRIWFNAYKCIQRIQREPKSFFKKMTCQKVTNLSNRGFISEDCSTRYSAFYNTTFHIQLVYMWFVASLVFL